MDFVADLTEALSKETLFMADRRENKVEMKQAIKTHLVEQPYNASYIFQEFEMKNDTYVDLDVVQDEGDVAIEFFKKSLKNLDDDDIRYYYAGNKVDKLLYFVD
jgi:hypothetical protein